MKFSISNSGSQEYIGDHEWLPLTSIYPKLTKYNFKSFENEDGYRTETIEIHSLKELMNLLDDTDRIILTKKTIEIYDDWREW